MNNLLNFEGVLRQAKCIQLTEKKYLLQLNAEIGAKVKEKEIVDSYRKYLGEDAEIETEYVDSLPIEQSGKTMVCEQRCEAYINS